MCAMNPRLLRPKASGFKYQSLRQSMVAYWSLNETASSGDVTAKDGSGKGYDLTSNNSVLSATGKVGNGRAFVSANSEWLSVNSNADLTFPRNQDWTIAIWVYPTGEGEGMFMAKDISGNREFEFKKTGTEQIYFSFTNLGGATLASGNNVLTLNTWHHLVVKQESNSTAVWRNAALALGPQDFGSNWTTATTPLNIGRRAFSGAFAYFDGTIDEVAIWRRALSSAEISELYNSGNGIDLGKRT
jgi:hypothetical protein